jgi:hypothetical protein
MVEYEKVCKDYELLGARLFSEKQKVIVGKKNQDAIRSLLSMFQRGVDCQSICIPLLPILVERNDVGFEKCFMVSVVHFVGLDLHLCGQEK